MRHDDLVVTRQRRDRLCRNLNIALLTLGAERFPTPQ